MPEEVASVSKLSPSEVMKRTSKDGETEVSRRRQSGAQLDVPQSSASSHDSQSLAAGDFVVFEFQSHRRQVIYPAREESK